MIILSPDTSSHYTSPRISGYMQSLYDQVTNCMGGGDFLSNSFIALVLVSCGSVIDYREYVPPSSVYLHPTNRGMTTSQIRTQNRRFVAQCFNYCLFGATHLV